MLIESASLTGHLKGNMFLKNFMAYQWWKNLLKVWGAM